MTPELEQALENLVNKYPSSSLSYSYRAYKKGDNPTFSVTAEQVKEEVALNDRAYAWVDNLLEQKRKEEEENTKKAVEKLENKGGRKRHLKHEN